MPLNRCLSPHVPLAVYELCTAGGQGFIRRTLQREGSPEVHETHRWPIPRAYEMWAAVLSGMAR
ncbi:hypothetical protein ACQP1K_00750 [Sphaerimonospora sp. CA-214678]|uniref:hypothetical protein n=1 Tax=Sphaerimonospora sp. CA-214678 TaxID=3240029 RepID=UPI003D905E4B